MSTVTNLSAEEVRSIATETDISEFPKALLVTLCRHVFGRVGDFARTSKGDYLAKLNAADRELVIAGICKMIEAGDLEVAEDDPAPAPARQAPASDDAAVTAKLRDALQALGIGSAAAAAPIDESAVREVASTVATKLIADNTAELLDTVSGWVQEAKDIAANGRERVVVVTPAGERREVAGTVHARFDRVVKLASIRQNVLLVGPAGCGKTKLCAQVADALSLPFSFISCSAGMSESQLQGWLLPIEAGGKFAYVPAAFVKAYEHGGVFLIDELDAADENLLLVINAALANGHMAVPQRHDDPIVHRHADFVCIAAANTFGHGADRIYAGRNQLDGATLDRFRAGMVTMDYDEKLEAELIDADVLAWGLVIRRAIVAHKLRRVMSTRALLDFTRQKDALGFTVADFEESYFADWTRDELAKLGR